MKTKKALMNVVINAVVQILNIVLALTVRRTFSILLGNEVLGLNSLFSSILAFLTLSESGIGISVAICLYKPIVEHDERKICSYMGYLQAIYRIIGIGILGVGLFILPFLKLLVKGDFDSRFVAVSFILYLISTAVTYFFSYTKILLGADQLSYIISASQAIYKIVLNVGQLIVLLLTGNYYLFLIVAIICNIMENYIVSRICIKRYSYIEEKPGRLSVNEKKDLGNKVLGMLCYKIANYFIEGTDNIIISSVIGTIVVAYYNNYFLIINLMYAIFAAFATSSIAGMGNLLHTDSRKLESTLRRLLVVQQYVFSFSATAFLVLSDYFVKTIFPTSKSFDLPVVILMVLVYYIKGYSEALEAVRNCAGIYSDRYINLFVAILNVIISVILVNFIGISGVLIGTLICYTIKEFIVVPNIVYNKILEIGRKGYYYQTFMNIGATVLSCTLVMMLSKIVPIESWIIWILFGLISLVMTFGINTLVYHSTIEYRDMKSYIINFVHK